MPVTAPTASESQSGGSTPTGCSRSPPKWEVEEEKLESEASSASLILEASTPNQADDSTLSQTVADDVASGVVGWISRLIDCERDRQVVWEEESQNKMHHNSQPTSELHASGLQDDY